MSASLQILCQDNRLLYMRQHTRMDRFALADYAATGLPAGNIQLMVSQIFRALVRDRQATPAGPGVPREAQDTLQTSYRGRTHLTLP